MSAPIVRGYELSQPFSCAICGGNGPLRWTPRIGFRYGVERVMLGLPDWKHVGRDYVEALIGQPVREAVSIGAGS